MEEEPFILFGSLCGMRFLYIRRLIMWSDYFCFESYPCESSTPLQKCIRIRGLACISSRVGLFQFMKVY